MSVFPVGRDVVEAVEGESPVLDAEAGIGAALESHRSAASSLIAATRPSDVRSGKRFRE